MMHPDFIIWIIITVVLVGVLSALITLLFNFSVTRAEKFLIDFFNGLW